MTKAAGVCQDCHEKGYGWDSPNDAGNCYECGSPIINQGRPPMTTCTYCTEEFSSDAIEETTHQQWQCPSCGSWNDRDDPLTIATVSGREQATILAALRLWQQSPGRSDDLIDIATNGGEHLLLTAAQVDDLCEKINMDADPGSWPWCEPCGSYHHPDNPTCRLKRFRVRDIAFGLREHLVDRVISFLPTPDADNPVEAQVIGVDNSDPDIPDIHLSNGQIFRVRIEPVDTDIPAPPPASSKGVPISVIGQFEIWARDSLFRIYSRKGEHITSFPTYAKAEKWIDRRRKP